MHHLNMGTIIRTYRKQQQLNQDNLAIGICTTSYLSRIENNLVVADESVHKLLLERLGKNYEELYKDYDEKIHLVEVIYAKLLDDLPLTEGEVCFLTTPQTIMVHKMHQIIYARYLLRENKLAEAEKILQTFEENSMLQHGREMELWIGISTYFKLSKGQFAEILKREQTNRLSNCFAHKHQYEKAIYMYHLAFAAHRHYQFKLARKYMKQSIKLFTHQYKPLFQLKLYSMHGVILNALSHFEEAKREFEAAIQLLTAVPELATDHQWASIYNNFAFYYESLKNYEDAQLYYQKSLSYKEDIHTAINLMRVTLFLEDEGEVRNLQIKFPVERLSIQHHKDQWNLIHCILYVESMPFEQFQRVEEQAMKSIIAEKHLELILSYAPRLAEIYGTLKQYKKMASYYKLAFATSEELRTNE